MPGLARWRQALDRLFAGRPASSEMQTHDIGRLPVRAPAILRGYLRLCRLAGWIDDYLNEARRRNQAIAIEETKTYLRAKRRSLTLLLSLLSPEQREEFRRWRHFHVIGGVSGTRYRIRVASFANIDVIGPTGRTMYRLCAHPSGDVPVYDVMAAQMLHLQDAATEKAFLKQANVHPVLSQGRRPERILWMT